jgi:hypothetical protein
MHHSLIPILHIWRAIRQEREAGLLKKLTNEVKTLRCSVY